MTVKRIEWNGFLELAVKSVPEEVAGFLFSSKPYSEEEYWVVYPVKNVHNNPEEGWIPDRKDMQRVKRKAVNNGLVKIGNVHTHIYPEDIPYSIDIENGIIQASETDLKFARRFNDIIRGILLVGRDTIYNIYFHDKFGNKIDVMVVEK